MKTKIKKTKSSKKAATKPAVIKTPDPIKAHRWTDSGDKVLILRRCNADGSSTHSFVYPKSGTVEAKDFNKDAVCGGGLHGWPWGMGLGEGSDYNIIDDAWLVLSALPGDVVGELDKGEKCKVRQAEVIFFGPFAAAWAMINSGRHRLIEAMSKDPSVKDISSGDYSAAASSGNYSAAASSGDSSKAASSGNYSAAASSGDYSKAASSGDSSKAASSGDYSKAASSGDSSAAASSGDYSKAASSGDYSKAASSGNYSAAASSGNSGIAASIGTAGAVKAGPNGLLMISYWVESEKRYRGLIGNVGENGIKADTWYVVKNGQLAEASVS